MERITFNSNRVWIAERAEDPDALYAKILICDFSVNLNNVQLERSTINNWLPTLLNQPLVGKIVVKSDGTKDFSGHNAHIVVRQDENGNDYENVEFDTSAFGSIIDAQIENIDGSDCIVATAKIWTRFYDACQIIVDRVAGGTLNTSWEIVVEDSEMRLAEGKLTKVIKAGRFIGHALLAADVFPAYPCSGLLDVAEKDSDVELLSAVLKGLIDVANDGKEEKIMKKNKDEITLDEAAMTVVVEDGQPVTEPVVTENSTGEDNEAEKKKCKGCAEQTASLTMDDLYYKLREACRYVLDKWCWIWFVFPEEHVAWVEVEGRKSELDYMVFNYTVVDDVVTVDAGVPMTLSVSVSEINSKMSELNSALATANETIENLNKTVASLEPYRIAHEQAEAERIKREHDAAVAELRQYVVDSHRFNDEELAEKTDVSNLIDALDKTAINNMIAERLIAELRDKKPEVQVSSAVNTVGAKVTLEPNEVEIDKASEFRSWLTR
jgi:hypothetical protein